MKKLIFLLFILFLLLSTTVLADGPEDPKELEAFLDGIIQTQMETNNIPGVTISVVKDGEIFLSKGYGYADVEKQIPVDPDKTLFRIASVSKLFTWTAIMQLHEQGKLDLNQDINTYFTEFQIPKTYPEPITLTNLLTHTAGFADYPSKLIENKEDISQLNESYLVERLPVRIYPPGKITAYSNYGVQVAGAIVQQTSGERFEDYIQKNIFDPLEMKQTSFYQPSKPGLESQISKSYRYNYGFKELDYEYFKVNAPSATITSTANDMAKFMIAHLQNGQYKNNSILKPETAKIMHSKIQSYHPKLNGGCYGFFEDNLNPRAIGHGGATNDFLTMLTIFPEENIGIFMSMNSYGNLKFILSTDLLPKFIDRYYPSEKQEPIPKNISAKEAARFIGLYKSSRSMETTAAKIVELMTITKVEYKNNHLVIADKSFTQIEPLVFQEIAGKELIIFKENKNKEITNLFLKTNPSSIGIKLNWYQNHNLHAFLFIFSILIFTYILLVWPLNALLQYHKKKKKQFKIKNPQFAKIILWTTACFYIFPFLIMITNISEKTFTYGFSPLLSTACNITFIATLLTIPTFVFAILSWKKKYWKLKTRIFYSISIICSIFLSLLLYNWNIWLFLL